MLLGGCGRLPETEDAPPVSTPAMNLDEPLPRIDRAGLQQFIEKHRGKVVLLDFWATWCDPCMDLFPHHVDLHRRFADRGLVVVAVSLDLDDGEPAARRFLKREEAAFANFRCSYEIGPEPFEQFEIAGGAIPHVRLYDRTGRLRHAFGAEPAPQPPDPELIEQAVVALLDGL